MLPYSGRGRTEQLAEKVLSKLLSELFPYHSNGTTCLEKILTC
jgi:hypothetical protein